MSTRQSYSETWRVPMPLHGTASYLTHHRRTRTRMTSSMYLHRHTQPPHTHQDMCRRTRICSPRNHERPRCSYALRRTMRGMQECRRRPHPTRGVWWAVLCLLLTPPLCHRTPPLCRRTRQVLRHRARHTRHTQRGSTSSTQAPRFRYCHRRLHRRHRRHHRLRRIIPWPQAPQEGRPRTLQAPRVGHPCMTRQAQAVKSTLPQGSMAAADTRAKIP